MDISPPKICCKNLFLNPKKSILSNFKMLFMMKKITLDKKLIIMKFKKTIYK